MPKPTTSVKTVMFVEDDPVLMDLYIRKFQEQVDVKLLVATDGQQAVEIIDRVQPDLLVTGINMPKLNGFGLLKHIQDHGYTFPTIVLTNMEDKDSIKEALALGAKEYHILKDVNVVKLKLILDQYLDH